MPLDIKKLVANIDIAHLIEEGEPIAKPLLKTLISENLDTIVDGIFAALVEAARSGQTNG